MAEGLIEKEIKQEERKEVLGKEITYPARKAIFWFLLINILLSGVIYIVAVNNQKSVMPNNEAILLFFSPTCPHCKLVEEFIANNSLDSKLNITQKNVWLPEIAKEYEKLADFCKIAKDARGVPMLYNNQTCYLGDVDAISSLKQLGGLK